MTTQYTGRPAASTRYDNLTTSEFIRELERMDIDPDLREAIIFRLTQDRPTRHP